MSKGLKVFALIMAAVILLTGVSVTGYYLGRNSVGAGIRKNVAVDLAAKPADTDEMTAAEVYEKVNSSVVGITIYNSEGSGSQASGVFYSEDGYIVTNDHIYSEVGAPKFKVYTSDGKEYDAKYIAGDQVSDLAVLKIDGSGFNAAEFGNSEEIVYGENVVSVGRPSDATQASSITKGIISSTGRRVKTTSNYSAKLIQTDSAINPGSSGGALVNMYGQVIGITSSKYVSSSYEGLGFAISINDAQPIIEELINQGYIGGRFRIGIQLIDMANEYKIEGIEEELGYQLPDDFTGIYITNIDEDCDIANTALKSGDFITAINGKYVKTYDELYDTISSMYGAGDTVPATCAHVSEDGSVDYYEIEFKLMEDTSGDY
ncbi:MAG: trypsin-like peptidase domain-containing protein [Oscillospiraceae bacterium]|nr:trypsin-like peptidase domain-containing protein [Oscillospiraceae bacterium]